MHPISALFVAQAAHADLERHLRARRLEHVVAYPPRPTAPRRDVWSLILSVRRFPLAAGG
jgi:hypothetical protein